MTAKLRPLSVSDYGRLPAGCGSCTFWETVTEVERVCGSVCDAGAQAALHHRIVQEWGDCGRVAYEDDDILGFIRYAPSGYFPQARTFASAPSDPHVPLLTCLHVSEEVRRKGLGTVLLRAALRDLTQRGERKVECFGLARRPEDFGTSPMPGMEFLVRNGFAVVHPDPLYPLLALEMRSLALWTESLESVLASLKLPLRVPNRVPAP